MCDKNEGTCPGGRRGDTCDPRLVQKIAEGKTSYELRCKAKVIIKKKKKNLFCADLT